MVLKLRKPQLERGYHRGVPQVDTWGPIVTKRGEIMNTQNAMLTGNQSGSDNGQEQERTLQEEGMGKSIDEMGTDESTSAGPNSHHRTCCCESCWPDKINLYL